MKECDGDADGSGDLEEVKFQVYDAIKAIQDPEKPNSLEDLGVVSEEGVDVKRLPGTEDLLITVKLVPTVPHCSLAALIGLCIRERLHQELGKKHKVDILITEGTHETSEEINKQLNDKERVAAALENPNLKEIVDQCLEPVD